MAKTKKVEENNIVTRVKIHYEAQYGSVDVQGIEVVGKKEYAELDVGFSVTAEGRYWLVYGVFESGDSFGSSLGHCEFVDLFTSKERADKCAKILREHNDSAKGDTFDNRYTANIFLDDGTTRPFYVPWVGYFERLEELVVQEVSMGTKIRESF